MSKSVELKIVMDNLPDEADPAPLAAEVQAMLAREYADGVKVNVSVAGTPANGAKAAKSKAKADDDGA